MRTARKNTTEANTPIPRKNLQSMIHNINHSNPKDRGRLVDAIERTVVPWLPIGSDNNGEIYRIVPGAYGLRADQENPKTHHEVLSKNVLGVNTSFQAFHSSSSCKTRFSEGSTKSNESDDPEIGGFVFHQLGAIERWGDEPENLTSYEDAAMATWMPIEFCAVVRFGRNGCGNGIYVIQDFYPRDESGKRGARVQGDDWGYLAGADATEKFSMARIANSIKELRFGRMLDFKEVCRHPVELFRAIKTKRMQSFVLPLPSYSSCFPLSQLFTTNRPSIRFFMG